MITAYLFLEAYVTVICLGILLTKVRWSSPLDLKVLLGITTLSAIGCTAAGIASLF